MKQDTFQSLSTAACCASTKRKKLWVWAAFSNLEAFRKITRHRRIIVYIRTHRTQSKGKRFPVPYTIGICLTWAKIIISHVHKTNVIANWKKSFTEAKTSWASDIVWSWFWVSSTPGSFHCVANCCTSVNIAASRLL